MAVVGSGEEVGKRERDKGNGMVVREKKKKYGKKRPRRRKEREMDDKRRGVGVSGCW